MTDKTEVFDVAVIGAGVIGCAVARELTRRRARILVLERESDVGEGTSKANSAIIHGGFDAKPGTLKAKYNVLGNAMMDRVSEELDVPFSRIGALVVSRSAEGDETVRELLARGEKNGVKDLRILSGDEARAVEPGLTDDVTSALFCPSSGIVCPFELTLGFAENAAKNGAVFKLNSEVTAIRRENGKFIITASGTEYSARAVVNCAGVFSAKIREMIAEPDYSITPRRGEYLLLDKNAGGTVSHTVFGTPSKQGKGVLVTPTVHGNLMIGPTAEAVDDPEDTATTGAGISKLKEMSAHNVKNIPYKLVITSFAGLRATGDTGDFIIREDEKVRNFFEAAAIESPGLSSAPAIGAAVAETVSDALSLEENGNFDPIRRGVPRLSHMSDEERAEYIKINPDYGQIICRCEGVSEGEILDAIRRPLGATTLDGVKRRVRAGMGRCQAGFCSPRVIAILSRELGIPYGEVKKNG